MVRLDIEAGTDPVFSYHLLRTALGDFQREPSLLEERQYQRALEKARRSHRIESLVLESAEAEGVLIPASQIDAALAEVAGRYETDAEFDQDLGSNGLDRAGLHEALRRELVFDAVMQKVGSRSTDVKDIDTCLFYELHSDRFETPELRTARHILVTINPDFPENTRPLALERIHKIARKLNGRTNRFAGMARRESECPTAMDGGKLGEVNRDALYPELGKVLFGLKEGQISGIVESELGFHLLLCERIRPARRTPFSQAAPRIREVLKGRLRRNCQKAFLSELQRAYDA